MLGTILERAVRDGILAKNPARGIKKPKDNAATPAFNFDKVRAVGKALREEAAENALTETAEAKVGRSAIRALLLTGFRRMEGLTLKVEMVDSQSRCARLPETKSGAQMRALGRAALEHLAT